MRLARFSCASGDVAWDYQGIEVSDIIPDVFCEHGENESNITVFFTVRQAAIDEMFPSYALLLLFEISFTVIYCRLLFDVKRNQTRIITDHHSS